jgi:CxxC motif-containing protein (DUF1111 family)
MRLPYPAWYALIAVVLLAPAGIRVLTRPAPNQQPLEPEMVQAGKTLFNHVWTPHDPLCAGGDGLGPVFNASSCAACHHQGGVGGAGGREHNVTMFVVQEGGRSRSGVVHSNAVQHQETLQDVHSALPAISRPSLAMLLPLSNIPNLKGSRLFNIPQGVQLSQRNTPALFGARLIDEIPERDIIAMQRNQRLKWAMAPAGQESFPSGRAFRLPDGRIGRFGWKAQSASLSDFVRAACANELGLSNPGNPQPQPLGKPDYQTVGYDLTRQQCDQITAFVAALPRPAQMDPDNEQQHDEIAAGKRLFHGIGCADCHVPDVGSVAGLYSDLLLHRMGMDLEASGSYNEPVPMPQRSPGEGPFPDEWRTPPLWGVADSGPYLHDGRAETLEQAIKLHTGQAAGAAQRFNGLTAREQAQLVAFLKSLRAPARADSNKPIAFLTPSRRGAER